MDQLAYFRLFHHLDQASYDLLTAHFGAKKLCKGDIIIRPGQIQRELLFVSKGVQMSYYDTGEKRHVIAFTYPPNLCAIPESFSMQSPSRYYLQCLTDSEFQTISFTVLQTLFDQSQTIERLFRKMTEAVLAGLISRHIDLHALSMEERFIAFAGRSPQLLQLVPHKYIASYLDIDPTNFSKLYNRIPI